MVLLKYWTRFVCTVFAFRVAFVALIYCEELDYNFLKQWPNSNLEKQLRSIEYVADIQSNGLRGFVHFIDNGNTTLIKAQIFQDSGEESYTWKIYSFSDIFGDKYCSNQNFELTSLNIDLTKLLGPLQTVEERNYKLNVSLDFGDSLIGRTLVIQGIRNGKTSCATILPNGPKLSYRVNFYSPIVGVVYIIKQYNSLNLLSNLYYSNEIRKFSRNKWALMESSNVDNDNFQCNSFIGRPLSDENSFGLINIGMDPYSVNGRSYLSIRDSVGLETVSSVYMVIYKEDTVDDILSCSPLLNIWPKKAISKFNYPELRGYVAFSQETPFDPTFAEINLELNQNAYSYGIDELPKIIRSKNESLRKCPNIKSIIYNPFNISPYTVPMEGQGTSDMYAVGDLSGKYGSLANKSVENFRAIDSNLPLFGRYSIIGRALVFYSPSGEVIACANVELMSTNMTTAFATFDDPIQGQFIFRQPAQNCSADTYVYLEISKPEEDNATETFNHSWFIHQNPIIPDDDNWSTMNCLAAGVRYNPYNVSNNCLYERDCTPLTPLRCEMGDTSSKLGNINIPLYKVSEDGELDIGKYFFTDVYLPLCGPNNIIKKSLIINKENFGKSALACANIIEYKPKIKST